MDLFNVYPLIDIEPVKAKGCYVTDSNGETYLDLYGGHAVISIGHSHPHYVSRVSDQLGKLGFYSNSVLNGIQEAYAEKLGQASGYEDYHLFLCNSGAEANENALKLASFHNGKSKVIAFEKAFHGRTSGAVAITDNPSISAPINHTENVKFLPLNDVDALETALKSGDICAVIIEGIQGVSGIHTPTDAFLQAIEKLCKKHEAIFIMDEIQSGFGRTGDFFAHQHASIKPDLITMAKGMGNGFPIGGVLISPKFEAKYSLLGTTFGGNHLACAAGLAVLEVMEKEELVQNAREVGQYLIDQLQNIKAIEEIRGRGLMLGLKFSFPVKDLRNHLVHTEKIFTGSASDPYILRLLPPLSLTKEDADHFVNKLNLSIEKTNNNEAASVS